jgi:hypothetical protein
MEVYDELDEAAKRFPKKKRGSKDTKSYQDGRSQAGMMVLWRFTSKWCWISCVVGVGYKLKQHPNERQPHQKRRDPYTRDEQMEYR